jgi:hypothetical protein
LVFIGGFYRQTFESLLVNQNPEDELTRAGRE